MKTRSNDDLVVDIWARLLRKIKTNCVLISANSFAIEITALIDHKFQTL